MIVVHPTATGHGFTLVGEAPTDEGSYKYVREGDPLHPWSQAEALHRAEAVSRLYGGLHEVMVDESAPAVVLTGTKEAGSNVCTRCGHVIAHTGQRGRPRKTHRDGECPA